MKKILLILMMAVASVLTVSAKDIYSRDAATLPAAARNTIQKHFKSDVALIKIDKSWGSVKDYEVTLDNGAKIEFDGRGNLKEVEVGRGQSVPSALLPNGIVNFVKKNHKGQRIVGFERVRGGYEVTLSNDIEMKFDNQSRFREYDD